MPEHKNDKAEESTKPEKAKKPVEYRRFEKMLKQVLKAPPLRKIKDSSEEFVGEGRLRQLGK